MAGSPGQRHQATPPPAGATDPTVERQQDRARRPAGRRGGQGAGGPRIPRRGQSASRPFRNRLRNFRNRSATRFQGPRWRGIGAHGPAVRGACRRTQSVPVGGQGEGLPRGPPPRTSGWRLLRTIGAAMAGLEKPTQRAGPMGDGQFLADPPRPLDRGQKFGSAPWVTARISRRHLFWGSVCVRKMGGVSRPRPAAAEHESPAPGRRRNQARQPAAWPRCSGLANQAGTGLIVFGFFFGLSCDSCNSIRDAADSNPLLLDFMEYK